MSWSLWLLRPQSGVFPPQVGAPAVATQGITETQARRARAEAKFCASSKGGEA
ncbi:hypothetical protein ABZ370_28480 [Streptomyces sp. NPDC005962]|uniref:hypothetical protein n=1 Tax=Streptomyces sp. NPDC005962 TaxID=3154466 RepID=UPI00340DF375